MTWHTMWTERPADGMNSSQSEWVPVPCNCARPTHHDEDAA